MNRSGLKTFHLTLWEEFSKKSFVIQFILVILLVSYCRDTLALRPLSVIFTILAVIISFPFLLYQPILGIFVILFMTVSFIDSGSLPLIHIFGLGSLHVADMLFITMFLFVIGRKIYYKKFHNHEYPLVKTPLDIPLALFFLALIISLANSLFILKSPFTPTFRYFRFFAYYPLFFLITNLVESKKDLLLFIRGVIFIALITALVSISQQFLGLSLPLIFGRIDPLITPGFGEYTGVTRVIPSGIHLEYFSLIALVCVISSERFSGRTVFLCLGIVILGLGIIFTYYRNMWVSACLCILLFFSLATMKQKVKFILWSLIGIWAVVIFFLYIAVSPGNRLTRIVNATEQRMTSLFRVKSIKKGSSTADTMAARSGENELAFMTFLKSPIWGIGFGKSYGQKKGVFMRHWWDVFSQSKKIAATGEIHNSLLVILMRTGLLGSISFVWISVLFLMRGFRNWKKINDPFLRAICIGFTVSYIGTLISSTVEPFLNSWRGIVGSAILWGTNEVIYRVEGIEDNKKGRVG